MKIYLGFTVAGNRSALAAARSIFAALRSLGHEVLTTHLLDDDAWEADRRKSPQEIFARDMNWLAECDVFVAEVSGSSFGLVGSTAKKTILFYERGAESRISLLITGNTHPNCSLVPYDRTEDLPALLADQRALRS